MSGLLRSLVDTGPLVALLDDRDEWHESCVDAFSSFRLPFVTSVAVLTESLYFIRGRKLREAAWTFFRSNVTVEPIGDEDLPALQDLMDRYHDRPMDFADATLVHIADRLDIETVFTTDVDDFQTYRIRGRKKFRILPNR